jgi:cobalt/nickel transport system permease protein
LDARLKLVFCLGMLVLVLGSSNGYLPLLLTAWCWLILSIAGVSLKLALRRLSFPLFLAGVVFLLQLFTYGTSPLFGFSLLGHRITAYSEGFYQGGLIVSRVLAGVSLVLFLTLTTPTPQLLRAAQWFGLPPLLVELALLTYSYLFLFHQAAVRIAEAQRVRLGYVGVRRSLRSLASLIGLIFIQVHEQAQRSYEAMLARGYGGRLAWPLETGSRAKVVQQAVAMSLCAGALYTLSLVLVTSF